MKFHLDEEGRLHFDLSPREFGTLEFILFEFTTTFGVAYDKEKKLATRLLNIMRSARARAKQKENANG